MKPKPLIVQARIEGGELKVPGRKFLLAALKGWPDGPCDLEIRPFEETRRARANRYLFGVVYKIMAEEMGQPVDALHEVMKLRHNSARATDPSTGEDIKIAQTTTKLTVQQFSDYIEAVMLDGAEYLGLTFPPPRESEEYRAEAEYREAVRG